DMVVTRGDWPKVWTRGKGRRKRIVVTETLITTSRGVGNRQKAGSQAGLELRRGNIFCRPFITASSRSWDGLGISQKPRVSCVATLAERLPGPYSPGESRQ